MAITHGPMSTFTDIDWDHLDELSRDLPPDDRRVRANASGPVRIEGDLERLDDGALRFRFATQVHPDPLQVTGVAEVRDGQIIVTEFTLRMQEDWSPADRSREPTHAEQVAALGPGITSATLRAVQMGRLTGWIRGAMKWAPHELADMDRTAERRGEHEPHPPETYAFMDDLMAAADTPTPGRRGRGDDFYRHVAHLYLHLQSEGWSRGILNEIARQLDRPRETVSSWVNEARKREFLSGATPGRAGRTAGPRLGETAEGSR